MSSGPLHPIRFPVRVLAVVLAVVLSASALSASVLAGTAAASGSLPSDPGGSMIRLSLPRDLNRNGTTLPKTSYAIPPDAIYMSPIGDDGGPGSVDRPVRTLNRAVALASGGGTVVLRGGEYRDWYTSPSGTGYGIVTKALTFQAYPGELPWLDGSDVIPAEEWTKVGKKLWSMPWSTPEFCDGQYYARPLTKQLETPNSGPCAHFDMSLAPGNRLAVDPQMAFVDDRALHQVSSPKKLAATSFSYDHTHRRIYLAVDPAQHEVELTRRPVALVLGNRQNYRVLGLGFRKYASNEYGLVTSGALRVLASTSLVENSVFARNAAGGLAYSNPAPGSVVRRSVFAANGYTGLAANGASSTGQRNDLLVSDNVFYGNNAEKFGTGCTLSCGQAAAKFNHMVGLTLIRNVVENTRGAASGLWCDLDCTDTNIIYNLVQDNGGGPGIIYEVSDTGLIAANQVIRNKYGITVASANTKVYNNTLVDNRQGLRVYDDRRTLGKGGWNDIGPDTRNVELVNNVVAGPYYSLLAYPMRPKAKPPNTGAESLFTRVDHNTFQQTAGKRPNFVYWKTRSGKVSRFREPSSFTETENLGRADTWVKGKKERLFVNKAQGDLHVRGSGYGMSAALPADVAAALGVPADQTRDRGVVGDL
jgi:parallel beta-helix repeat protein